MSKLSTALLPLAAILTVTAAPCPAMAAAASTTSTSSSSSSDDTADCDQARAAQDGADRAEERIDGVMDELIGKSDAAEKCIGSITAIMPQFEQFSDLNFDGLLDKLKEEICKLASDVVKGAVNKTNDEIDDLLNSIIGNVTLPDGTTINPVSTVMPQNPGIGYTSPSSSSSSTSSNTYTDSKGTVYTPADPSTGTPASLTYTPYGVFKGKTTTVTAANLVGGAYTFEQNGVIAIFTPSGPYDDYAGSVNYPGGGWGGFWPKHLPPPTPDGRLYSSNPNPWAGVPVKSLNSSSATPSSDASPSDTSSSWWSNIWK